MYEGGGGGDIELCNTQIPYFFVIAEVLRDVKLSVFPHSHSQSASQGETGRSALSVLHSISPPRDPLSPRDPRVGVQQLSTN